MNKNQEVLDILVSAACGVLEVSPHDFDTEADLLSMGADSLVLMEILQLLEDRFGVSVPVARLFQDLTTASGIANFIQNNRPPVLEETVKPISNIKPDVTLVTDTAHVIPNHFQNHTPESHGDLISLMGQQLRLMQAQLDTLSGTKKKPDVEPHQAQIELPKSQPVVIDRFNAMMPDRNPLKVKLETTKQKYLESIILKFSEKTKLSKAHTQKFRFAMADNRASAGFRLNTKEIVYPIVFRSSHGSRVSDLDGNDYLDLTMGFGVNLFGHNEPFILKAVHEQLEKGMAVGPQSELSGQVAEVFCKMTGNDRVVFTNSGTEAVMLAVRLARSVTGRKKIMLFANSYHGTFDGILARSRFGDANGQGSPVASGIPESLVADVIVAEFGSDNAIALLNKNSSILAAVLVEPVQSRNPGHQPTEFLKRVRQITKQSGTALIFDEVITGLRTGQGGAQEFYSVKADLATYGKVLGGGFPIGAVAGDAMFLNPVDGGFWRYGDNSLPETELTFFAGTFCKHPLAMAASKAVLLKLSEQGGLVQKDLNEKVAKMCVALNRWFDDKGLSLKLECFGSLFRFSFQGNLDLLFYGLILRNIYIWEGRNLFISRAHSDEELSYFVSMTKEVVEELIEFGFIEPKEQNLKKA